MGRDLEREWLGGEVRVDAKAVVGIGANVVGACEVAFAASVKTGDPTPAEGVGGGVAIEQVTQKPVGSELPREFQAVYPDTGIPHACVIVQLVGFGELFRPCVETVDAGLAADGVVVVWVIGVLVEQIVACEKVVFPYRRTQLQPALPVGAPADLVDVFGGSRGTVAFQHGGDDVPFGEHTGADPGGEAGNGALLLGAGVGVAPFGVIASSVGKKVSKCS